MSALAQRIDALACQALRSELMLPNKPGLVSPGRNGSHSDMDEHTFHTSVAALQGYFGDCFKAGEHMQGFKALAQLGVAAEARMLEATQGVNTHKGAIFLLGLLAGAAGRQWGVHREINHATLGRWVSAHWGAAIVLAGVQPGVAHTHGRKVKVQLGLPGAREQAVQGFPTLFEVTLPQHQWALAQQAEHSQAAFHALMATMGKLPDTNLAHRGGLQGLEWAQKQATQFLHDGGVFSPNWRARRDRLCDEFEVRWLSPGGSADLLSASFFLQGLSQLHAPSNKRMEVTR
jgi:triphosphoribosyl-dephospho-CoA synthase